MKKEKTSSARSKGPSKNVRLAPSFIVPRLNFTPTSALWLSLVERWFAALTEKQTHHGSLRSPRQLEDPITNYLQTYNCNPRTLIWTKTADPILENMKLFWPRDLITSLSCPSCFTATNGPQEFLSSQASGGEAYRKRTHKYPDLSA